MNRNVLVAAAWPYANGSLHLGHASALIASDILARYFRLAGDQVLFVSGSDCHGTPIAFEADKRGVKPEEIAEFYHEEFRHTLIDGLGFSFDNYTKTTTENHVQIVQKIFLKLYEEGFIYTKTEDLPYCETCGRFLPDRYIEGECPLCHFDSARGDQCDNCGELMDTKELIKPRCKICGNTPHWRPSEHFYLKLSALQDKVKDFVNQSQGWRANAKKFSLHLLENPIPDRAITRDTDWGITIPLPGYESKKIYVWFEAVCGYFSASVEWAEKKGQPEAWKKFWENNQALHYYVHGKDNIPFHTIIWPTILLAYGGLHLPDRIVSSEYLTLENKQFSKSRHWAVWLPDFIANFDSDSLRYYLTAGGPETSDADFSWKDYQVKTNSELIGNFGNLVNRVLSLIKNNFPDGLDFPAKLNPAAEKLLASAKETFASAGQSIEASRFREGLKIIFQLSDEGNKFLTEAAPWVKVKTDRDGAAADLAVAAQVIRCLSILVAPYLPKTAVRLQPQIGLDSEKAVWEYPAPQTLKIETPQPLFKRIEDAVVEEQIGKLGQ